MHRILIVIMLALLAAVQPARAESGWDDLVELFRDWRAFEQPPVRDGAPDYTAKTNRARHARLGELQSRLNAFDIKDWPVEQQIDWHLVRAEMNGMDFHFRVLRPWERDPAFYTSIWTAQSDTPAHEGPAHHAIIDTWTWDFPLSTEDEARFAEALAGIPPLLEQARVNLTGNARELWIAGITNLRGQDRSLAALQEQTAQGGAALRTALAEARAATQDFIAWLEAQGEEKTGPSGIGIENYSWHLQNVLLLPLTWEDEVRLLKRELDRALSSLQLEEHRNRDLPPLAPIDSATQWALVAEERVIRLRDFLRDEQVLPAYDYIEAALRAHQGSFVPAAQRNFFVTVAHHEPMALWTHWYHWFDLARMANEPHSSPIRRGPLLYNVWMSRAEGMATGFEEMTLHAGLYDDNPRARELVWIMLAQRAARGLGSLYAQANQFTLKEARDFHVAWTPRGWMREDLDLLGFEQLLYLRQPGYGTSYITGKYLIERLLGEYGKARGTDFELAGFFAELDQAGVIPVPLLRWQLLQRDDELQLMLNTP